MTARYSGLLVATVASSDDIGYLSVLGTFCLTCILSVTLPHGMGILITLQMERAMHHDVRALVLGLQSLLDLSDSLLWLAIRRRAVSPGLANFRGLFSLDDTRRFLRVPACSLLEVLPRQHDRGRCSCRSVSRGWGSFHLAQSCLGLLLR